MVEVPDNIVMGWFLLMGFSIGINLYAGCIFFYMKFGKQIKNKMKVS